MKTKPTQASVKELQGMGIWPDIIVCRSEHPLDKGIKDKIALSAMFRAAMFSRIWTSTTYTKRRLRWKKSIWLR